MASETGLFILHNLVMFHIQPGRRFVVIVISEMAIRTVLVKNFSFIRNRILTCNVQVQIIGTPDFGVYFPNESSELMTIKAINTLMGRTSPGSNIRSDLVAPTTKDGSGGKICPHINQVKDYRNGNRQDCILIPYRFGRIFQVIFQCKGSFLTT